MKQKHLKKFVSSLFADDNSDILNWVSEIEYLEEKDNNPLNKLFSRASTEANSTNMKQVELASMDIFRDMGPQGRAGIDSKKIAKLYLK